MRMLAVDPPPDLTPSDARATVMFDVAFFVGLACFTWMNRRSAQKALKQDVQTMTLLGEQSTFSALLDMICEVVIELDGQLRLVGPSEPLCTFLLRGSTRALEGTLFADLLPKEEERAIFSKEFVREGGAHCVRFSLRDGNGALIEVDMFHSWFKGPDGMLRCFAGLCECCDRAPPSHSLPPQFEGGELLNQAEQLVTTCKESVPTVLLDSGDPNLVILEASEGFEHLTGGSRGNHFIQYIGDKDQFVGWLQARTNVLLEEHEGEGQPCREHFKARLRPRVGSAHSHLRATCGVQLKSISEDASDEEDAHMHVLIQLSNLLGRRGAFGDRHGSSRRSRR